MKVHSIKKHKLVCLVDKIPWFCGNCYKRFTDVEFMRETMESCTQARQNSVHTVGSTSF